MALLEVNDLTKHFRIGRTAQPLRAVDGVTLTVDTGETLGLVGESGCGKSTLGRCILRLIEPSSGVVRFDGTDIRGLNGEQMRLERRRMQIVFQDPFASLNPRMRVGDAIGEPLRVHKIVPAYETQAEIGRLLGVVGLSPEIAHRYPHEFSGGQRQRIGIARALAVRPKLIIADEPISALDVSIRAQILNLFRQIQQESGVAILFIAHDLGSVRQVSSRVAVMYLGKIVETADADSLYDKPQHPYTRALLAAAPTIDGERPKTPPVEGDPPSPIDIPSGCRFRTRCPFAQPICAEREPELTAIAGAEESHLVSCHLAATLPAIALR